MHSRDRMFPVVPAEQQGLEAGLALPSPPPTQTISHRLCSGLLRILPVPTLLLPHCCFNMVGGGLPAHSHNPPCSSPLSHRERYFHLTSPPRLSGAQQRRWLGCEGRGRSLAGCSPSPELTGGWAMMRVCMQGQGQPLRWLPGAWLSRRFVLVLEPRGLCPVLLGVSWCSELALDTRGWHQLRTNSVGTVAWIVVGGPVSPLCLHAPVRNRKGVNSL